MIWKYFAQTFLDQSTVIYETGPIIISVVGIFVFSIITIFMLVNEYHNFGMYASAVLTVISIMIFTELMLYDYGYQDIEEVVINKQPKKPEQKIKLIQQKAFDIKLHPEEGFLYIINGEKLVKVSEITDVYLHENDTIYQATYTASVHNITLMDYYTFYFLNKEDIYHPKPNVVKLKMDEESGKLIESTESK